MRGLMQEHPLILSSVLEFAERFHHDVEIVSRNATTDASGALHRYDYRQAARRSRQLANALDRASIVSGERVASLAWNGHRHFELYYGVSGSGRILHTVNPRLHATQVRWIINHAEDRILFFDLSFVQLVCDLHAVCPTVERYVALCSEADLPTGTPIPNLVSYETWIARESDRYKWPSLEENTASSLCYTSGTTGRPKGVLYSHRSSVLHAMGIALPDSLNLSATDTILPVVPMFHVNAWGLPYAAAATGCRLVFPGAQLDGASLYELIEQEGVTMAAGVPTVWQGLLAHVRQNRLRFSTLDRVVVGGAACSRGMFEAFRNDLGIDVIHAWGMTETSPLGTVSMPKAKHASLDDASLVSLGLKQGRPPFGVDLRIVDDDGEDLPWDGVKAGHLQVKGPWMLREYFGAPHVSTLDSGWFPTGDVGTLDADGYLQITDRSKDVIKSGGEWISSIELENIAMSHHAVVRAACIGVPHPRWNERPIVLVVKRPEAEITREELLALYAQSVSKWQIPDDVIFVDDIPLGATGKIVKYGLREAWKHHLFPAE